MIGCLRTHVRKQPIITLYFESETVLKFYNLEARIYLSRRAWLNVTSLNTRLFATVLGQGIIHKMVVTCLFGADRDTGIVGIAVFTLDC